jgi:hypothetical protein
MVRVYTNEEINELSKYLMQEYGVSYRHFKVAIKPLAVTGGALIYNGDKITVIVKDDVTYLLEG